MDKLAELATRRPWLNIAVFAVLTAVAALGIPRINLDASMDALFPDDSGLRAVQDEINLNFGAGVPLIALVTGDIYTPAALEAIRTAGEALASLPGVSNVLSVANADRMEDDDGFLLVTRLLPASGPISTEQAAAARTWLDSSGIYAGGLLVSAAGDSATIVAEVDASNDSDVLVAEVERILDEHWRDAGLGEAHLAGTPVIDSQMRAMLLREAPLLGTVAAALLILMLWLNFRSTRGTLLPVLAIIVGLSWSLGTLGWLGGTFSTFMMIAPVAILAVGSSLALHLLGRYGAELAHGRNRDQAIRAAVAETGLGILISGLAIAAALLTFTLSGMPGVRSLGLVVSGGVFASLVATLLLLPAVLSLMAPPRRLADPEAPGGIAGLLRWLGNFTARRRGAILVASVLLAGLAGLGVSRIEANTAVLEYFQEDSAVRRSFRVIDEAFGGSSQLEILVRGNLGDPAALQALEDFQEQAALLEGVGRGTSIATVVAGIHETLAGEPGLPATREAVAQEMLIYQMSGDVAQISRLMTIDSTAGLINLPVSSGSTRQQRGLLAEIETVATRTLAPHFEYAFAGTVMVQLSVEDILLHDFIISLSLAVLLVVIIDSMVRSIPAALVTIVVLLLTILLQYGMLGILGSPLDLATMLLGALAIGVGDYAIHLTVRYMEERRQGHAPETAMSHAIMTSGRSILFTALTLGAGFGALIFSDFVPVRTLGILMTFTVVSVGVISLTLLPAACLTFLRNPRGARSAPILEVPEHA